MNKWLKITLIVLGSLLLLVAMAGAGGWMYLKNTFLDFEKNHTEKQDIQELTIDAYTFLDRNGNEQLDIYEDDRRSIEARADDLLSKMTQEEKIHLLKGSGIASALGRGEIGQVIPGAVGTIVPTPRLGIPTIYLSDGPAGLRIQPTRKGEDRTYYCTAFPIASLLASSWNKDLVYQVGDAMGSEALEYGIDVILGPGANIHRHPFCGRNFEYYSEDPLLTGKMGAAMVNGIEDNGVGTSVKHFVANNQETNRNNNNAIVSDRALREIYLRGFQIIVEDAQPWTIMSSYNKVNGSYVAENEILLTDVLRDDWGFEGIVMSDWFGGRDAPAMISAGNDLLEPGTKLQWKALKKAAENGALSQEAIDTSVKRILKLILGSKKMQNYDYGNDPNLAAHAKIARQSAAEGMVLLKNNAVLPLRETQNIALIGVTSYDFIAGGTGSGDVNEAYTISLEQGLSNAGFEVNAAAKQAFETHKANNEKAFDKPEGMQAMFQPYDPPELVLTQEQLAEVVATADIGILTIGRNSGEGGDRIVEGDFRLSEEEQEMLSNTCEAFQAAGKQVVVVLNIGGVIETASWKEQPDAILLAWQGGQEGGNAAADILSGKVNPSGKLPMTFPIEVEDHASHDNFPPGGGSMDMLSMIRGTKDKPLDEQVANVDFTRYEEGIYVGYRHFDKEALEVSYPFGSGLSYTDFDLSDLVVIVREDSILVNVEVQNTGDRPGKEVVQIYSTKPDSQIDRPEQELQAFAKTPVLAPGASATVTLQFPISYLRYWDEDGDRWQLEEGKYQIKAAKDSRDAGLTIDIVL